MQRAHAPIRKHLVIVWECCEYGGVSLVSLLPSLVLHRLVPEVAAHRSRLFELRLGHRLEGVDDVLLVGVGGLVLAGEGRGEERRERLVQGRTRAGLRRRHLGRQAGAEHGARRGGVKNAAGSEDKFGARATKLAE